MEKIRKQMREVEVVDYYAEVGDVISIPGKRGKFVVEEAGMTGGGTAQGGDIYPDAWHVKASLLFNEQYRPDAKDIVEFTQHTNCYNDVIDGVEQVGQMKKVVAFEWVE